MLPQDAEHPEPPAGRTPRPRPETNPIAGRVGYAAPPPSRPAAPPPGLSAAPTFGSLLKALRRRWLTASVLSVVCGAAAAGLAWWLMTPKHIAFSQILVKTSGDNPFPGLKEDTATGTAQNT